MACAAVAAVIHQVPSSIRTPRSDPVGAIVNDRKERVAKMMRTQLSRFITDDQGQDLVEYSLILVLIGTVALIFISGMGVSVSGIISTVSQKLESVSNSIT